MDFLKKNYEKILLTVVLLGLVGVVVALLIIVPQKRQEIEEYTKALIPMKVKPLPPLDTKAEEEALARVQSPSKIVLSGQHNLFNPVLWQMTAAGVPIKIDPTKPVDVDALKLTGTKPLLLKVTYGGTNASGFVLKIENQADIRNPQQSTVARVQGQSPVINYKRLNGTIDNPVSIELQFKGESDTFTLLADPTKPYTRTNGYTADLKYPDPTWPKSEWKNVRPTPSSASRGATLIALPAGTYWVIDVNENSATICSTANNKKTTIFLSSTSDKP